MKKFKMSRRGVGSDHARSARGDWDAPMVMILDKDHPILSTMLSAALVVAVAVILFFLGTREEVWDNTPASYKEVVVVAGAVYEVRDTETNEPWALILGDSWYEYQEDWNTDVIMWHPQGRKVPIRVLD